MVVCQSQLHNHHPVWSGPLSADAVRATTQSPIRLETAKRLLSGESAVWLMVQSGNKAADRAAWDTLQAAIRTMNDSLKLPKPDDNIASYINVSARVPLMIRFSALAISRADPAEQIFLRILTAGKLDLDTLKGPAVSMIFGRGRNLDVLSGKHISARVIRQACRFLVGICSCTIKESNPGVDMLMAVDWDGGLAGSLTPEPLPSLTGMTTMGKEADAVKTVPAGGDSSGRKYNAAKKGGK